MIAKEGAQHGVRTNVIYSAPNSSESAPLESASDSSALPERYSHGFP
jgi:hypothetical protein